MPSAPLSVQQRLNPATPSAFRSRLDDLGPAGRLAAFQAAELSAADVGAWYASYPDEVPLINGEFPWIAATLE
jgi:hypothetical protein